MKRKVAIVTGATGGLGREFVKCLLDENVDEIWAIARNEKKLATFKEEYGERLIPISKDLSRQDQVLDILSIIESKQPEITYLINNAGIARMGNYDEFSAEEINQTIALNCSALAVLSNLCIPYMTKGSRIMNLSSQSSFQPVPYINLYAATKAFERSYTRALNVELKGTGITATAVCPGWVDTELLDSELNGKKIVFPGLVSPDKVARQAMEDAKKGKDMSICTNYVKFMHFLSKILSQKKMMNLWTKSLKKYHVYE